MMICAMPNEKTKVIASYELDFDFVPKEKLFGEKKLSESNHFIDELMKKKKKKINKSKTSENFGIFNFFFFVSFLGLFCFFAPHYLVRFIKYISFNFRFYFSRHWIWRMLK